MRSCISANRHILLATFLIEAQDAVFLPPNRFAEIEIEQLSPPVSFENDLQVSKIVKSFFIFYSTQRVGQRQRRPILTVVTAGKTGLQALLAGLFRWRVGVKWYLIALMAPVALELMAIPIHQLLDKTTPAIGLLDWMHMLPSQLPLLAPVLLFLILLSVGEELGWRGYALPSLQARYGSLWASLILGVLWGFWHLPVLLVPGTVQSGVPVPGYVLATIGYSFIYTCIYNGSKGSLLLASLYHAASNLVLNYGDVIYPAIIENLYLSLIPLAVLVLAVMALSGPGVFSVRTSRAPGEAASPQPELKSQPDR
jgi:membrane protease YdiL (CAAX protease family)